MKVARFVLKIIALTLATAALVCCVIAYWDKLIETYRSGAQKVREKIAKCPLCSSEYDDYADWE